VPTGGRGNIKKLNPRNKKREFQLEVLTHFPHLTIGEIENSQFIEKLVYEFAKFVCPVAITEVDKFYIHGQSSFEVENNYLMICYQGLYGKKNFARLTKIFNTYNRQFCAYYTDGHHCNFMSLFSRGYYVICFRADIFLQECFTTNRLRVMDATNVSSSHIKSDWLKQQEKKHTHKRKIKPINHYNVHALELEFMESKFPLAEATLKIDTAISFWRKKRRWESLVFSIMHLFYYCNRYFHFYDNALMKYILKLALFLDEMEMQYELPISRYKGEYRKYDEINLLRFFNGILEKENYAFDVVEKNDSVVIKFIKPLKQDSAIQMIQGKFNEIVGENNFKLAKFIHPIDDICYIYVQLSMPHVQSLMKQTNEKKEQPVISHRR